MTIALVSDTHGLLRPEVVEQLQSSSVERILHMGDVGKGVLEQLEEIAPVVAIRGNTDFGPWAAELPATRALDVYGWSSYMLHNVAELDLDPKAAGIDLVLFGHTHAPADEVRDGVRYVNPGSIGPRRFSLPVSYALVEEDRTIRFVQIDA